ncbi:hypothetical protein RI367_001743 [Sorochytrium milnesiophthora]
MGSGLKSTKFNFLPQVDNIVEQISTGASAREVGKSIIQLNHAFAAAVTYVEQLNARDTTLDEQQQAIERLQRDLRERRDMLQSYLALPIFADNKAATDTAQLAEQQQTSMDVDDVVQVVGLIPGLEYPSPPPPLPAPPTTS